MSAAILTDNPAAAIARQLSGPPSIPMTVLSPASQAQPNAPVFIDGPILWAGTNIPVEAKDCPREWCFIGTYDVEPCNTTELSTGKRYFDVGEDRLVLNMAQGINIRQIPRVAYFEGDEYYPGGAVELISGPREEWPFSAIRRYDDAERADADRKDASYGN